MRWRQHGRIMVAAGAIGLVSVGVVSRLAMGLLALLNPRARGMESDDGFVIGRVTLSGSLNLLALGLVLGLLSGVFYLLLSPLQLGPRWFQTLSISLGSAVVVSSIVVHADGVDFTVLDPVWLGIGLFVAIPFAHVAVLDLVAHRIRDDDPSPRQRRRLAAAPAWAARLALTAVFVLAATGLARDVTALV